MRSTAGTRLRSRAGRPSSPGPLRTLKISCMRFFWWPGESSTNFGDAKVTTWLYRITERVVQESRRKERFRRRFSRAYHLEIEDTLAASHLTPVDELERQQSTETTYRILDRLPDKYRTVLILFELEELSGEEIAALTGLKLSTVWVHLHRARARFLVDMKRVLGRES